jgi:hypothetical protein
MINLRKTLNDAHKALTRCWRFHMLLIGGFALASYGQHRATSDIDLLADGSQKELIKTCTVSNQVFHFRYESAEVLQFEGLGFLDILLANQAAQFRNAPSRKTKYMI